MTVRRAKKRRIRGWFKKRLTRIKEWLKKHESSVGVWITAVFTGLIFLATFVYALVSVFQWQSFERSIEVSNRAYVSVNKAGLQSKEPKIGEYAVGSVNIINKGNTPALRVDVRMSVAPLVGPMPEGMEPLPSSKLGESRAVIPKDGEMYSVVRSDSPFDQVTIDDLKEGKQTLYAWGINQLHLLASRFLRPELVNRITEVVAFMPLGRDELARILDLILMEKTEGFRKTHNITVNIDEKAKHMIIETGFDPQMGARPLERALEQLIVQPLVDALFAGRIKPGEVLATARGDQIMFIS